MSWTRVEREVIYAAQNADEISVERDTIRLPSGDEFAYVHVNSPYEVVFVVGLDDAMDVLILRQYRYLADRRLIEIPAGSPDEGESLEDAARREFEEESGYRAGSLKRLAGFYSSVGMTNQYCHIFLATDLVPTQQALEQGEDIDVERISIDDAVSMVFGGEVENGGAALALLLAGEHVGALRLD